MNQDIIPLRPATPATREAPGPPAVRDVDPFAALLADSRTEGTRRVRVQDMADLAGFLGVAGPSEAARLLISGTAGQANTLALGYVRHLLDRGLAPATIARRISTLRRAVKLARRLGLCGFALDIDGVKTEAYRDTAGVGDDGWRKMLAVATARADSGEPKGLRDLAALRLLHDVALRRAELVAIDVADLDLDSPRVAIKGKRSGGERRWVTLPESGARALAAWVLARGREPGPLFVRLDRAGGGRLERLSGDGVHEIVRAIGRAAGLGRPARPHALRHQAITRALTLTNGNVRVVQKFSRHAKADTVCVYDDSREDLAGEVAKLLGSDA